jgi:large repetitive protein
MKKPLFNYAVLLVGFFSFLSAPLFAQCLGDTIPPIFERCPQNIVVNQSLTNPNNCVPVQWDAPVVFDNCGVASLTSNHAIGECFPIGTTQVIYIALDSSQIGAECSFTVTVLAPVTNSCATDSINPILRNCPQNIVINTADTCAIATWTEPTATDNCSTPSVLGSHQSGTCFPLGSTIVMYMATDSMNNKATCAFAVFVNNPCAADTTKPVFTNCPANIVIASSTTTCAAAQWTVPRATDECGAVSTFATAQPGRCFPIGISTVTYRATDLKGNVGICTFTVNVSSPCAVDTTKPVISACPANIVVGTYDTCAIATWGTPTATDNCSIAAIVPSIAPNSCFPIGTTTVTYTARDSKNNMSTCSFNVTVNHLCEGDTTKPVLTNCPTNIVLATADTCAVATWANPTITDNCGTPTLTSNYGSGTCFKLGTTTVTYTGKDTKNNTATCTFNVTVNNNAPCAGDTSKPVLTRCPSNIVLNITTLDTCSIARWSAPRITDNCGTPTLTSSHLSGACFPVGKTTVTYTGKDTRNNTAICAFTVTVTNSNPCFRDTIKPVLVNCPANIVLNTADTCAIAQWAAPTATDNCGAATVVGTHTVGTCFPIGTTTVGYAATDAKGNRAYCTFTVTVNRTTINPCATDFTKPVLTRCPTNISLVSIDSCTFTTWTAPTATDNCGIPTVTASKTPNMCFNFGTTTVTYTAKDNNNNTATCSFTVTVVKPCATDTIKPRFGFCPSNIALTTYDTCATATWVMPIVMDNCSANPTLTSNYESGKCFKVGTTNVVYTATDDNNNKGLCSFNVVVTNPCLGDVTKPVIRSCPANIVINTADSCSIARWTAPTVTDNCGIPTLSASTQSGLCFKVGVTTVTYTAKDTRGNTSLCTFTVTVNNPCFRDSIKPVIRNCPVNIAVNATDSCAIARWTAPTATDNCGTPILTASHQSGTCFRVGSTTVTYTAKDAKNNAATCTFNITVINPCFNDTIKPTLYGCPANITKTTPDTAVAVTWTAPTALDNCSVVMLATTNAIGSRFNLGNTTVTYTAMDAKNNKSTCSFTVTINQVVTACTNDTIKPVFTTCPANITVTTSTATGMAQWALPTATDNCSTPSVSGTFASNASFPIGTTAVVFTATDAARNVNYCRFNVTIVAAVKAPFVLDSSKCYILVAKSSKKAMTVANASTVAGAYGVQWAYMNALNQKWKFTKADSNSYNITSRLSNLNLDTRWGSTAEGARLMQWGQSAAAATQKWQLVLLSDGYYKVVNKGSGRALSVSGGSGALTDGALLIQSTYAMQTSQQWNLVEVPCTSTVAAFATTDMLDMSAQPEFNRARIEWTDNTGYKNDYYEVQKLSATTGEFERLEIVNNKTYSNTPSYQSAYDNKPIDGDNTYRVKLVQLDSVIKYSPIKTLNFNGLETIKLFPNPANDYVDIDLARFSNEAIGVYVYNAFGKQVAFQLVQKDKFSVVHFDVSHLEMGNYVMRVTANGKRDVLRQLQIVR